MSEGGYKELDLDNPGKAAAAEADSDIEIVHEGLETPELEIVQETPTPAKAAEPEAEDEDDDSPAEASSGERKKLTRSQRLKAQRDAYARQLTEVQDRLAQAEQRAKKFEQEERKVGGPVFRGNSRTRRPRWWGR